MKDTELRRERDREVYAAYQRCLEEKDCESMKAVAHEVSMMRAPKFYISSKSLANYFRELENGTISKSLHPGTRAKVQELYRRYIRFKKEHPRCELPRERICEILIDEEAPSFYIGEAYIIGILQKERQRHREEMIRRYMK